MKNQFKLEIKKILFRPKVLAAIFGVLLVWYIGYLKFPFEQGWVSVFIMVQGYTITIYLSMMVAAGACSLGFCEDYEHRYYHSMIMRSSPIKYMLAKFFAAALTSFLIYTIGTLLYLFFIAARMPAFPSQDMIENLQQFGAFADLIPNHPWMFVMIQCVLDGLLCSILCCGALCFSVWIPNKFTVLCVPLVLFWLEVTALVPGLKLPAAFDWELVFYFCNPDETSKGAFAVKVISNVLGYYTLFGILMSYRLKRRYCNE